MTPKKKCPASAWSPPRTFMFKDRDRAMIYSRGSVGEGRYPGLPRDGFSEEGDEAKRFPGYRGPLLCCLFRARRDHWRTKESKKGPSSTSGKEEKKELNWGKRSGVGKAAARSELGPGVRRQAGIENQNSIFHAFLDGGDAAGSLSTDHEDWTLNWWKRPAQPGDTVFSNGCRVHRTFVSLCREPSMAEKREKRFSRGRVGEIP